MNRSFFYDRPDEAVRAMDTDADAATPVVPLPNPGEGGPVYDGTTNDTDQTPVIPLPNPGEGGPAYNGNSGGSISIPIYRPIFPDHSQHTHVIGIVPGVTFPCTSCNTNTFGKVRFLNAASGYQPFYVYLGNWLVASSFGNGDMSGYLQAASGSQTVTISGANGYVYVQKQITVKANASVTLAIINTSGGLDLLEISDSSCGAPSGASCLRVCNLSLNLGPFDVSMGTANSSYTAFTGVGYKEVTPYTSFYPGWYQLYIARSGANPSVYVATAAANMSAGNSYTLYLFNASNTTDGLKTMVVSN